MIDKCIFHFPLETKGTRVQFTINGNALILHVEHWIDNPTIKYLQRQILGKSYAINPLNDNVAK